MKFTIQLLSISVVICGFIAMQGCKPKTGPGETIEDQQLAKLSKSWKATSVSKDNVDLKSDYANFVLTISGTAGNTSFGYSTSGAPALSPWPSSGNWSFGSVPTADITRDKDTADELAITYSVTETVLQITFNFNGDGYPGRTNNVKGQWVFEFGL